MLLPCKSCGRHVKSCEPTCPFCGEARACDEAPVRGEPVGSRLKAIAVSAAIGVSACSTSTGSGGPVAQPLYGAVTNPVDGGGGDGASDAPQDSPTAQPAYGAIEPNDGGVPKADS